MQQFFRQHFCMEMPKYVNPADYLIKIAHDPKTIRKDVDKQILVEEAANCVKYSVC